MYHCWQLESAVLIRCILFPLLVFFGVRGSPRQAVCIAAASRPASIQTIFYPYGIEYWRNHILSSAPFYGYVKNPCVKTVWLYLDSSRTGITFTAMILSRYIPAENKISPMLSSRLLSAMFCNKTYVCFIQLDWHYTGDRNFCQGLWTALYTSQIKSYNIVQ